MKQRDKKTFIALLVVAVLLVVIIAIRLHGKNTISTATQIRLRQTVLQGVELQEALTKWLHEGNSITNQLQLDSLFLKASVNGDGFSEDLSVSPDAPGVRKIALAFDGNGGWWFDVTNSQLRLNSDVNYYLNDTKSTWIQVNKINFKAPVQIPVDGEPDTDTKMFLKNLTDEAGVLQAGLQGVK